MKLRSAAIGSFALLLQLGIPAAALETVTIRSCYDGDTCRTSDGERIRLACIDTSELRGKRARPERARAARDHLRGMVVGKSVGLRRITTDRYGRTVGELFVDGMNVQQAMVASRHAEIFWRYASQCPWTR
ncbi:thermonuclease family protein [Synechococcus sp. UW179A]|uniref:thermonuclease family protein n=1 Tax=Synechococcus sp. UW179A TaxID=2575510 RepID=UPI000E0E49EC|nr:thermonuclease family protein [Synechococcus sp. UW179A]